MAAVDIGEIRKAIRDRVLDQMTFPDTMSGFDAVIMADQEPVIANGMFLKRGDIALQIRYVGAEGGATTGISSLAQHNDRFHVNIIASLHWDAGGEDRLERRNKKTLALDTLATNLRKALQASGFNAALNTSLSTTTASARLGDLSSIEDNIFMDFAGYTMPVIITQTVI